MKSPIITAKMLREKGACREQVEQFATLFPSGTTVTLRSARRAASAGLSLDWFAVRFLSAPALRAYEEACATALVAAWDRGRGAR